MKARTKVYLEAARRIDASEDDFACHAISFALAGGYGIDDESNCFADVFAPADFLGARRSCAWLTRVDGYGLEWFPGLRDLRVLMLCLMAAMVEAGDA